MSARADLLPFASILMRYHRDAEYLFQDFSRLLQILFQMAPSLALALREISVKLANHPIHAILGLLFAVGTFVLPGAPFAEAASSSQVLSISPLQPSNLGSPTGQPERSPRRRSYGPMDVPAMPQDPRDAALPAREPLLREGRVPYSFYFSRIAYSGVPKFGYASWTVDFPKADRQLMLGVRRLIETLDLYPFENALLLDSEELRDFPFLYAVEVGHMVLSAEEKNGLRDYLLTGGFLMVDDFWGDKEWAEFEREISEVLPGYQVEKLPMDHAIFHTFYDIERVVQVPNLRLARNVRLGLSKQTWEFEGFVAEVHGIFDEHRRLMVAINWNGDLGDAWEWAESSEYPLEFSRYAYEIAVNTIVYAMTH